MRLPSDAALLNCVDSRTDDGAAAVLRAWREEALPVFHISGVENSAAPDGEISIAARADDAFADTDLETRLDAIGATTLVFAGAFTQDRLQATVFAAVQRGYRVFVVGSETEESDFGGDVRVVSVETALEAARLAKFRQRWALARRGG
jgi:isochorismate hydrolase